MPVLATQILKLLGNILGGWAIQFLLSPANMKWMILWCGRRLVKNTATTADDEWFTKFEAAVAEGAAQPAKAE